MIPHSHEFEKASNTNTYHFENFADDNSEANNIHHQDHIDENIFDLIICIFSHTPHSEEIDHQIAQNNTPTSNLVLTQIVPVVYFWIDNFIKDEPQTLQIATTPFVNHYQFDYYTSIDLRGPPAFLV